MTRTVRFVVALVIGLAALTWLSALVVTRTLRHWHETDARLRAQLAFHLARPSLLPPWRAGDRGRLEAALGEIARDERILGAAACTSEGTLRAATAEYPRALGCEALLQEKGRPGDEGEWTLARDLASGRVHATMLPLADPQGPAGFVVLVHDLGWLARREEQTATALAAALAVLALAAALVTVVAGRLSWRRWTEELRRLLRGGDSGPEFRPLLGDVRDLVSRLASEQESGAGSGWSAQRLRATLDRELPGEKVVVLSNREPYIHERLADGKVQVIHPASGLVTALEPVMRACSGTWVAHGSGSADRQTVDAHDRVLVPPGQEAYQLRRVWLGAEEEQGYYYGFANEGLWPLCHLAHTRPVFREGDLAHYRRVNQRFADAVCEEVDRDDPLVLVQDYHFALAPRMIRERLPRATILTFWHIPWPNAERFGICPWREELLEGLLGSSIVGFHTQLHCNNFLESVDRLLEARLDREQDAVIHGGQVSLVRPYPISIEWPSRWEAELPKAAECRREVLQELGLAPDVLLGVGVDRLDYTKGIEERLLAVESLLERHPELRGRFTFVQLAAPSRTAIEPYRLLHERVEALVRRINARFLTTGAPAIVLLRAHHEPPRVFRFFRAANVCYVSSLHDGMNLVAKEFVSARDDEQGALVLSHFTGAARELPEALIVNPYDVGAAGEALYRAVTMPAEEQRSRLRAMRALVSEFNVYRWAGRMLVDAARLRRRGRLSFLGGRDAGAGAKAAAR